MEKKVRKVIHSSFLAEDIADIYQYGIETFGKVAAAIFLEEINHEITGLSFRFRSHPECRHLSTKTRIYRNIIIGKYLVVYRIRPERIEVLRAFHGSRSVTEFRPIRSMRF